MLKNDAKGRLLAIRDRSGRVGLQLDAETGLPRALLFRQGEAEASVPFTIAATLFCGGEEVPAHPYGIGYENTDQASEFRLVELGPRRRTGPEEIQAVVTRAGDWSVTWEYTFRESHPRLELNLEVGPLHGVADATLRNFWLEFAFGPRELELWRVEAPGDQARPGVAATAFEEAIPLYTAGGPGGAAGLVALHREELRQVFVLWPFCRTEVGAFVIRSHGDSLRLGLSTELAARLNFGEAARYGAIELDALDATWEEVRDGFHSWYAPLGLGTPHDRPAWVETASIFEVQIGYAPFSGGYRYEPYPTLKDLMADLGRIKGLGFDVLQIMPRHPYPSYNVHDYADVTTTYGEEEDLRALVEACHALGMRVILDILMHGVIDKDVIRRTAKRVRSGPYADRLDEATTHFSGCGPLAADAVNVSWSRHILDFEPYWLEGAPERHPLLDEHPEWFMRDSRGEVIGVYTNAFDAANVEWQEYFCEATEDLIRRLDIDGFRFDAPAYNKLPNWSKPTEGRASYSPLGTLQLFERLRPRLKRLKEDIMLYTEPSGVLFRQAMDVTYNYDEHWLPAAVLRGPQGEQARRTAVRNGREMAAWFRERDAVLPKGSLIAHHVDSHDTFWWPLPGEKWAREQYGLDATRALLAVQTLTGGAFMTFIGGEKGLAEDLRRALRLRRQLPEIGRGLADYSSVSVDHEAVYAVVRRCGAACSVLLVNLSGSDAEALGMLDVDRLGLTEGEYEVYDVWNDRSLGASSRYAYRAADLRAIRLQFDAFEPKLLVVRPVSRRG